MWKHRCVACRFFWDYILLAKYWLPNNIHDKSLTLLILLINIIFLNHWSVTSPRAQTGYILLSYLSSQHSTYLPIWIARSKETCATFQIFRESYLKCFFHLMYFFHVSWLRFACSLFVPFNFSEPIIFLLFDAHYDILMGRFQNLFIHFMSFGSTCHIHIK